MWSWSKGNSPRSPFGPENYLINNRISSTKYLHHRSQQVLFSSQSLTDRSQWLEAVEMQGVDHTEQEDSEEVAVVAAVAAEADNLGSLKRTKILP